MARLYGGDEDFWTSSDEDEQTGEEEEEIDVSRRQPAVSDALAAVYQELIGSDTLEGEGCTFAQGRGEIPEDVVTKPSKGAIRKRWVIHDSLTTEHFEDEIPDPALE